MVFGLIQQGLVHLQPTFQLRVMFLLSLVVVQLGVTGIIQAEVVLVDYFGIQVEL
jgi:hypothetical protein